MKIIFVLITSFMIFTSCSQPNINTKNSNTTPSTQKSSTENEELIISKFENGLPKLVQYYKNVDGIKVINYQKEYFDNGIVSKEGTIENDKKSGLWKTFRPNGMLWSEGEFANGIRNGIANTFHPNGKVYYLGQYKNGQKSGIWKFYNEKGDLLKEADFNK